MNAHRHGETTTYTKPSVANRYAGTRRRTRAGRGSRQATGRQRKHRGTAAGTLGQPNSAISAGIDALDALIKRSPGPRRTKAERAGYKRARRRSDNPGVRERFIAGPSKNWTERDRG